jgi:N-methylhydantoinase A
MLAPDDPAIDRHLAALEATGRRDMEAEGLDAIALRSLDLRYAGQGYELRIDWSHDFLNQFHRLHERRYGYSDPKRPVQVVNARVRMISVTEKPVHEAQEMRPGNGTHALLADNLYDRAMLHAGDRFAGPAVIVEYSATTYVPPGAAASVDALGNLIIEVQHD